jgi:acyl dehydratase
MTIPLTPLYLEDLAEGQTYASQEAAVDAEAIKSFAQEYDPQPFHLDERHAAGTFFGGLVASGWQTAALTMKLLVASDLRIAGGLIGAGVDELRWPRPVRPGDVLHVECEILETRASKSRSDRGVVKARVTTVDQAGNAVQQMIVTMIVPRRPQ